MLPVVIDKIADNVAHEMLMLILTEKTIVEGKMKFSLHMSWRHISGVGIATFILNLGTRWRLVVSLTCWALYSLGKESLIPIELEAGCVPEPVLAFWRTKTLAPSGIWSPDCPVYSLIAILIVLSRLATAESPLSPPPLLLPPSPPPLPSSSSLLSE